ncbi:hypothetical protein PMI17_03060 [Pantoea sp. GM01]|nr:hypothetical protein PMI17_03060 [Pantoea sp. GM01]
MGFWRRFAIDGDQVRINAHPTNNRGIVISGDLCRADNIFPAVAESLTGVFSDTFSDIFSDTIGV